MFGKTNLNTFLPREILNRLDDSINFVANKFSCYCFDAVSNFTHVRKPPADVLIKFLIQKQSRELNDFFLDSNQLPLAPALVQQHHKLSYFALKRIMDFTKIQDNHSTYKGYHQKKDSLDKK